MSIGLQFIHAAIAAGSVTGFREVGDDFFVREEMNAVAFVRQHIRSYGRLPSIETCAQNGVAFPRISETFQYYDHQLRTRAMFNRINADHPMLLEAMRARNMNAARDALRMMLTNVNALDNDTDVTSIQEEARMAMEGYDEAHNSHGGLRGVTLGWDVLDEITQGAQAGDVIVVVGRPSEGKSYLLIHMLKRAWLLGSSALFTSMEMTTQQITRRLIAMTAGVNPDFLRNGRLSTVGHRQVLNTIEGFDELPPLHMLSGDFRRKVADIDKIAQQLVPDIFYIDAGYLLAPSNERRQYSRREQIADVLGELKAMSIARRRPIVLTVQFNRDAKKAGADKELDVSQIAETDVIGQLATVVIGVRQGKPPFERSRRRLEIIKNRDGSALKFTTRFQFAPIDFSYLPDEEEQMPIEQTAGWTI